MTEPIFWLGLSILLVAVCLAVAIAMAIPALLELARAARSIDKLADTLRRELPPTLEAIRLTGLEISDLKDDISEGVQSAGNVARQVDQSLGSARNQVRDARVTTRSVFAGVKAAWRTWTRPAQPAYSERRRSPGRGVSRPPLAASERLSPDHRPSYPDNSETVIETMHRHHHDSEAEVVRQESGDAEVNGLENSSSKATNV